MMEQKESRCISHEATPIRFWYIIARGFSRGPFSCLGFVFLFFSDCFPFNFNFYYNSLDSFFSCAESSPSVCLARGAVHLKWLMPKIEINTRRRKGGKKSPNLKYFCLRLFHVQRNIDAHWTPEDIAGVFRKAPDHYNSWEVFNELMSFFVFCPTPSVACPFISLLSLYSRLARSPSLTPDLKSK